MTVEVHTDVYRLTVNSKQSKSLKEVNNDERKESYREQQRNSRSEHQRYENDVHLQGVFEMNQVVRPRI
jgi:hypothetical protein